VAAIESGWYARAIEDEAYRFEREVESGERAIVGVNRHREDAEPETAYFRVDPSLAERQLERLDQARAGRDAAAVEAALAALRATCGDADRNCMPAILDAVRAQATLGEICAAMRDVFGSYRPQAMATG
jgi:methylmalonyl-CoA mutase N-terminal domain/subunit